MQNTSSPISSALLGLAVGDALGVPVEFLSREVLRADPVTLMRGYGTHNQPAGTWSDDSSLAFCLAESLCNGYDLKDLSQRFINWYAHDYWTPHGSVFDVGNATAAAIRRLEFCVDPVNAGGRSDSDNGNGSLMRILPLLFFIRDLPVEERFKKISEVSSLTHGHIRSVISCFIYLEWGNALLTGMDKWSAFEQTQKTVNDFLADNAICSLQELHHFDRILNMSSQEWTILPEEKVYSSGYVIHTLEASIWSILSTSDYPAAVLRAVNLGSDTDTTGAVTGGLAGIIYGIDQIPEEWRKSLARYTDILDLIQRLEYLVHPSTNH
jgi:ADP-ribosyl-[dinitrogen reductase] hydrolase